MAASPPKPCNNCEPSSVSVETKETLELPFPASVLSSSISEILFISLISLPLHSGHLGNSSVLERETFQV